MLGDELVGVATIGSRSAAEFSEEDRLLSVLCGPRCRAHRPGPAEAEVARRNDELAAALDTHLMLRVLSHDLHTRSL